MSHQLFIGNDHRVALEGNGRLEDQDGGPVIGATVEMTLYAMGTSTEVAGVTWPVVLDDLGDGEYDGRLPADAEIEIGEPYELVLDVTADNISARWQETVIAAWRSFRD